MLKLNERYHTKYCECCGRTSQRIWAFLNKQKSIRMPKTIGKSRKEWKGHKVFSGNDYFYDNGHLMYCGNCGKELDEEEEIKTVSESRGEFWGAPCSETVCTGYECFECGYNEVY